MFDWVAGKIHLALLCHYQLVSPDTIGKVMTVDAALQAFVTLINVGDITNSLAGSNLSCNQTWRPQDGRRIYS